MTGLLAKPHNAESFAQEIEKLILNDIMRSRLGNVGCEEAKMRSWDSVFSGFIEALQKVIKKEAVPLDESPINHHVSA